MIAAIEMLPFALTALDHGLNVLPPRQDGTKAPDAEHWTDRQHTLATPDEIRHWYNNGRTGIGYICGAISGGLEMFEFEGRAIQAGLGKAFSETCRDQGIGTLIDQLLNGYLELTPSGGLHLLYRCDTTATTKLARTITNDVLIETKGEGGYTIAAPTYGNVHPTHKPWEMLRGGVDTIPTITVDERAELHRIARTFDETIHAAAPTPRPGEAAGGRPGDDYNTRANWTDILGPHGWTTRFTTRGGNQHWTRPGKEHGTSATINEDGNGVLYVFTSSTPFEPDQAYSRFAAYTTLNHQGDYQAAARQLRLDGYGDDPESPFSALAATVQRTTPQPPTEAPTAPQTDQRDEERFTDVGNARRLVAAHGHHLRYVPPWGTWLAWDGQRWRRDTKGVVVEHAKQVAHTLVEQALNTQGDDRKPALRWALQSESAARLEAMIRLARTQQDIPVEPDELDADPWILNVGNGVIDLRTGQLLGHNPARLVTRLAAVDYNPQADAPRWHAFLEQVLPSPDVREFIARWFGYCLTGDVSEQKAVFAYGIGANGKTTALNAVAQVLGEYAGQAAPDLLMRRRDDPHPTGLADLHGRRLVLATETAQGRHIDEALLKRLTGGDRIKARHMHKDFFEFPPTHKFVIATNHRPGIEGTDHGIWRRLRLIPFDIVIPDDQQDRHLDDKLADEAEGILRWAVAAGLRWQTGGLTEPAEIVSATADYRAEMDPLGDFISDCCVLAPGLNTRSSDLYAAYGRWAEVMGEQPMMTRRKFGFQLRDKGLTKTINNGVWWAGIALTDGVNRLPPQIPQGSVTEPTEPTEP